MHYHQQAGDLPCISRDLQCISRDLRGAGAGDLPCISRDLHHCIAAASPLHLPALAAPQQAINFLAWGRKRWLLARPSDAFYSKKPADAWLRDDYAAAAERRAGGGALLECVQAAGDALIVPQGWGHLTMNLRTSVGVAFEAERADVL